MLHAVLFVLSQGTENIHFYDAEKFNFRGFENPQKPNLADLKALVLLFGVSSVNAAPNPRARLEDTDSIKKLEANIQESEKALERLITLRSKYDQSDAEGDRQFLQKVDRKIEEMTLSLQTKQQQLEVLRT